jgi:hypothetical protein
MVIVNRVDGEETKRVVHKRKMARLVRMIVDAAPSK